MCGLCDAYETPEARWWRYGEYTGENCPNCGRQRLMRCEQASRTAANVERVICEKCHWEPARNDYCAEALGDR